MPCEPPADLERALGAPSLLVLKTPFDYLVELVRLGGQAVTVLRAELVA